MARGRLEAPNLDDRTWQDIVDQARALIPTYAPEWTDHNPSDLGMTLIELFAWMVEGLIYRLNRVPEKNYIAFLNLLGITRDPATPASVWLTYRANKETTVPKGSQAATAQTETEDAVIYETDMDWPILPINLETVLLLRGQPGAMTYTNVTTKLAAAPASGLSISIPDGQSATLLLGFDRASSAMMRVQIRFAQPTNLTINTGEVAAVATGLLPITWRYARGKATPAGKELWATLRTQEDSTNQFQRSGIVSFNVPQDWSSQKPEAWTGITPATGTDYYQKAHFWISLELASAGGGPLQINFASILFNSVPATNAATIGQPEHLGSSSGQPFQVFELAHSPIFKMSNARDHYDHLCIQVREPQVGDSFGDWQEWQRVDDLPLTSLENAAAGNVYRLDPVTGSVFFGDGTHGRIPPKGSELRAKTYRYVLGGVKGNVPPGAIAVVRTPVSGITAVANIVGASGGSDEEGLEEAKRRAPELLRNRYRAVTLEDYEYLAQEATTDIRLVRALPPRYQPTGEAWAFGGLTRETGHVNVIVVPNASVEDATPRPSMELLQEVAQYLDERRIVGTAVHVTGPRYLPINVTIDLKVWLSAIDQGLISSVDYFKERIEEAIARFLHPLHGGAAGQGWEIGENVVLTNLFEMLQPSPQIGYIESIEIAAANTPLYTPKQRPFSKTRGVWVPVADYELICSGAHKVTVTPVATSF